MYSRKIIQTLKPGWYLSLSKSDKLKEQADLNQRHKEEWDKKPVLLKAGTLIKAKESGNSLTKGKSYRVQGHFCTLISTIYDSNWNQFVTFKNDYGFTVKMNLRKFEYELEAVLN